MEKTWSSETLVVVYETTRRHTPEDINDCYNILIMLPHPILVLQLVLHFQIFQGKFCRQILSGLNVCYISCPSYLASFGLVTPVIFGEEQPDWIA